MNCVAPSSYGNESAIRRELKLTWLGVVVDDLDQCERIHIHDTQSLLPSECQKLGIWRPGWLDYSCGQSGISTAFKDMRWFLFNPIVIFLQLTFGCARLYLGRLIPGTTGAERGEGTVAFTKGGPRTVGAGCAECLAAEQAR